MNCEFIKIELLKPHEEVSLSRLNELKRDLVYTSILQKAITVDRETNVILNGHLRYFALLEMGFKRIAVYYVDYNSSKISFSKSSDIQTKEEIIDAALSKRLLPPNSSLHYVGGESLSYSEPKVNIPLDKLKNRILMVGVFDLFHLGHMNVLRNAKKVTEYNNYLIVGVQDNVEFFKGVQTVYSINDRMSIVGAIKYVDSVVSYEVITELINRVEFDVLVLGEDQNHKKFQDAMTYCLLNDIESIILPRTKDISTSEIKKEIVNQ